MGGFLDEWHWRLTQPYPKRGVSSRSPAALEKSLFFSCRSRQPDLYGGNAGEDETTKAAFEVRKEELQQDKKELEDCLEQPVIE